MEGQADPTQDATRLKAIAEKKFSNSNLISALKYAKKAHRICPSLDGLSSMLTAFKILRASEKASTTPDWYKILQVEPFSNINAIKKQYKKLALVLHPDKNSYLGCEDAFKLVGEGFRILSDRIRRKEYDMRLRIRLQDERVGGLGLVETFWTACSRCRLLHQFERRYLGHNLLCPSCKKSFVAVEVEGGTLNGGGDGCFKDSGLRQKMGSGEMSGEGLGTVGSRGTVGCERIGGSRRSGDLKGIVDAGAEGGSREKGEEVGGSEWVGGRLRTGGLRRRMSTVGDVLARSKEKKMEGGEVFEKSKLKKANAADETMTLAEMQLEVRKKLLQQKAKEKENEKEKERHGHLSFERQATSKKSREIGTEGRGTPKKNVDLGIETHGAGKRARSLQPERQSTCRKRSADLEIERHGDYESEDLEIMAVEDSDFYDFDKDRVEKSFKKGQVWAVYDDDDGMPRHYGLIDEVVSMYPFEVKLTWLDLQNNGDQGLIRWEKMGFHVSCGRFKVGKKTSMQSVNIFSHAIDCERAATEIYRIYPKKGSVWALYNEAALGAEGRNLSDSDKRHYDLVVFLTTYSEMHGLSMAYLEKVDGFKTIFKRREIGCHAIRWLEKDDFRLFSHQIPARKISGNEAPDDIKDCWELDPASLPSDLLTIGWGR
ncbi:DnaJ domain-containing protein/DUF3444 domain-containing protein [Cephalotus follicularis]|uniref:DnaJ domain-containing protein/DUF3444 domain-containing protein n=1 Tax=Cephalotus follicularis TaxID=3775 RepID=A0A1Q3C3A5_CEPFO|nr:DnaJ domain-containing protein/DUF3444 domain-containing protein [Cephalotus follicularis]